MGTERKDPAKLSEKSSSERQVENGQGKSRKELPHKRTEIERGSVGLSNRMWFSMMSPNVNQRN